MPNDVTFERSEYEKAAPRWALVDDCCAGSDAVKAKSTNYLPKPNPLDRSKEAEQRYRDYLHRATFYSATGRTLQGLTGMAFRRDPELSVPALLQYVDDDVDGAGVSIFQQSQMVVGGVFKAGRRFLLVDYPQTGGSVSLADMQSGGIRASIQDYPARSVINWRTQRIGGEHRLSLVVIKESAEEVGGDGFSLKHVDQYRALRLDGGRYVVEIWRKNDRDEWAVAEAHTPLKANGRPWDEIPGIFVGSANNDTTIDDAPLYSLAEVNIAHYRNSAEYEDTVFMCGQIQPTVTGVDEHWVNEVWKKNGFTVGSRVMMPLPVDGDFKFVQAGPNPLPLEAMKHKEDQMVALGAQLVTISSQAKTATEADSDASMNTSVLSQICANVSEAYTRCLGWMGEFMGATGQSVYRLSQDFVEHTLDAQTLTALVAMWQTGKLPEGDLWTYLRKYGVINPEKDDETVREELSTQEPGLALDDDADITVS